MPCFTFARSWRSWCTLSAALVVVWLTPTVVMAGAFQDFGYDTSAIGGANGDLVYGQSYGVVFSNPAIMSRITPHSGAGIIVYTPDLNIDLDKRSGTLDVPMSIYDAQERHGEKVWPTDYRPKPTLALQNKRSDSSLNSPQSYLTAGMISSFDIPGFRFGGVTMLPLLNQLNVKTPYFDEREANFSNKLHFARFGEWSPVVAGFVGVSYAPEFFKYISLGFSLQITATTTANVNAYVPNADVDTYSLMGTSMKAHLKFRPIVGLQVEMPKPLDFWSLGATWRNESYMGVKSTAVMDMGNYIKGGVPRIVRQNFRMALDYEPMEVAVATGFKYGVWNIQGGVTWSRWSKYRDLHNDSPQSLADYTGKSTMNSFKWKDTVNVTADTSVKYLHTLGIDWATLKLGFAYKPSPVPSQTGRTNFVDTNTYCAALGHRFDFDISRFHFFADLGVQLWMLQTRHTYKNAEGFFDEFPDALVDNSNNLYSAAQGLQTNNPGFPGYKQSGRLWVTSATVNMQF